ncbi:hypothetical protein EDB81DRAFT_892377 [Dactylonectria macrodidyma]|uniref:Uncharacterized protein n=1 Tax=Dactylonectria macrodidyma TaxID=307937 RepID=A0A9P9IF57_9HYPO|nr:hypothetical protein EDB81DRAFT_892377 [Dactylonectria macrodidyma]
MTIGPDTNAIYKSSTEVDLDVAIIGAGVSGMNTACYIQTKAPQGLSYTIFEATNAIRSTWDLGNSLGSEPTRTSTAIVSSGILGERSSLRFQLPRSSPT